VPVQRQDLEPAPEPITVNLEARRPSKHLLGQAA
jgi:hypothetical protein